MAERFVDGNRIFPIPEIFPEEEGRRWLIRHDAKKVGVDYKSRVILVPLDGEPTSHCIKLQQIASIKWDDRSLRLAEEMLNSLLFKAVNDHRLSFLLNQADIDIRAGFFNDENFKEFQQLGGEAGALSIMLMADYTQYAPNSEFLHENRGDKLVKLFMETRKRVAENPTKKNVVEIVTWLRTQLRDVQQPGWMKGNTPGKAKPGGEGGEYCKSDHLDFDDAYEWAWEDLEDDMKLQELPHDVREQLPKEMPQTLEQMRKQYEQNHLKGQFNPFGVLDLHEPSRNVQALGKFMKKWKCTEEGVLPRYPHRYAVDQRIFARRYKLPGGTVVIDSSGSMGLTPAAIKMMVEAAPGCIVANYSGTGNRGTLRILAKNGLRVQDDMCTPPCGGGNIVDYPALKWAFKHSHPRVWVSDLGVTGCGDQGGVANLAMCMAAVKKGRFFHATNCEEAVKVLKRLGRFYKKA